YLSLSCGPGLRRGERGGAAGRGGGAVKYMLLIYGDESAMAQATPEQNQAASDEYEALTKTITTSGNILDGDPFMPTSMATTVSAGGGSEIGTTGGPAVTTSPQL